MPEKKLYDWLYSRTWLRQKCQYSLSLARPLGARCGPLFLQSGHSHITASSRARACCFALSLLGLMRILSKNFDESIAMADYDNAMRNASSLDIAITFHLLLRPRSKFTLAVNARYPTIYTLQ